MSGTSDAGNPIDSFFGDPVGAPAAAPEPAVTEAEPIAPAAVEPPAPEPADDDAEPPAPMPGQPTVPRSALEDERRKRKDWKEQYTRADEQLRAEKTAREADKAARADLEAQLAELRKAAPAPAPATPAVQFPNPIEDPDGYRAAVRADAVQIAWDNALNMSEQIYISANPGADTKAMAARFIEAAKADPSLQVKLRQSPHPYDFVAKHLKKADALAKVGDDPDAWIEAELARRQAAQAAGTVVPAAVAPATPRATPVLPPSLATARSATPTGTPDNNVDILKLALPNR